MLGHVEEDIERWRQRTRRRKPLAYGANHRRAQSLCSEKARVGSVDSNVEAHSECERWVGGRQ